jgi:predicted AAA+ superfamily ATPase
VALPLGLRDIVAAEGPRRAGKTFLMLKAAEGLLRSGGQALYISFDEPQLRRLDARRLAEIVRGEYPSGPVHLFLDEVQEWAEWDSKLRWLHDVGDFHLYVTGSSSALQSSEIPSRLRGRYISKLLLPFSFREVAAAALGGLEAVTFRERGALRGLLSEYLAWGGFPEVWLYRSREKLVSLLETMFYRDIAREPPSRRGQGPLGASATGSRGRARFEERRSRAGKASRFCERSPRVPLLCAKALLRAETPDARTSPGEERGGVRLARKG